MSPKSRMAPPLCERCWQVVHPEERFIRLSHIVDVRIDGEPVYVFSYLHEYDPASGGCGGTLAAAA
jgi:hypothetical protein